MVLSIGTDCSGIEAPIEALHQLGIKFRHKWSCEIDPYARMSIKANYNPETLYDDITKRDHSRLSDIDIYVCGFPCQPFSLLGNKKGLLDERSNIMLHCIKVIKSKFPKVFILENVKNFKYIQGGVPFKYLIGVLQKIKAYDIYIDIMNTKDYGIPQNRERLYIIGIKKTAAKNTYHTPIKKPLRPFAEFLMSTEVLDVVPKENANKVIKRSSVKMEDNNVIACAGYGNYMKDVCPTITCSTPMYLTKYRRYLTPKELLLLQGFSAKFRQVVSDRQLRKQAGNSMSVNVMKAIFQELFDVTRLKGSS